MHGRPTVLETSGENGPPTKSFSSSIATSCRGGRNVTTGTLDPYRVAVDWTAIACGKYRDALAGRWSSVADEGL